ncbi:uncharacterized protein ASPGLDRAFT_40130 [Aspergillus glaucus CBS 516.65]|uniref:Uncharacterized protein n=1 Tax=Aspergillus glaucus CBS 516.65 TaxID=1160497 RepID=A0A1L9V5W6_ASPGL|nr:hypothetical protein ASPGLDRAFT_40130 [Aspergillus glaucus CBS 516.65]OJJ79269.1 hypothetical protein ASPGLDRAFT_40130 [Aspergillus glaucus CBS 516.65]
MGCCVLATLLPVKIDSEQSFRSVRDATHEAYWESVSHAQPIEHVVDWLSVSETDKASTQVLFVYHDKSQAEHIIQAGTSASNTAFRSEFVASIAESFENMIRRLGTYGPDSILRDIPFCSAEMEEAALVHTTTAMSLSQRSRLLDNPERHYLDALVFESIHRLSQQQACICCPGPSYPEFGS